MKVLIIAFEFPPLNTGGTRRPARMASYLAARGHEVEVWAGDYSGTPLASKCDPNYTSNSGLFRTQRLAMTSHSWKWKSSGYGLTPDPIYSNWKKSLFKAWDHLVATDQTPDFVILTLPPFSVASFLKHIRITSAARIITDMRDHWSMWVMTPFVSRLHFWNTYRAEASIYKISDRITVVTEEMKQDIVSSFGDTIKTKIQVVPNAWEGELRPLAQIRPDQTRIRIGYFGAFYFFPRPWEVFTRPWYRKKPWQWFHTVPRMEDWSYRSPLYFFRALDEALLRRPELVRRIEVVFAGDKPDWFEGMIFSDRLRMVVRHLGKLPSAKALEYQESCDAFLLTSVKVPGGLDYCVAGKTFEFFKAGKPILGFVTPGAQKWILEHSGTAVVCDPDAPQESAEKLIAFCEGTQLRRNDDFLARFRSERVMDEFEQLLKTTL